MLSVPKLVLLYNHFNEKYFLSELPIVTIKLSNNKKALGRTRAIIENNKLIPSSISISKQFNWSQQKLENTLLHEMIHVWQVVTNKTLGHGQSFKDKAQVVGKAHNTVITRTADISEIEPKKRQFCVMLNRFSEFLLINEKRVKEAIEFVKAEQRYTEVYLINTNKLVGIRVSRKLNANYYYTDKEIVSEIVNNGIKQN